MENQSSQAQESKASAYHPGQSLHETAPMASVSTVVSHPVHVHMSLWTHWSNHSSTKGREAKWKTTLSQTIASHFREPRNNWLPTTPSTHLEASAVDKDESKTTNDMRQHTATRKQKVCCCWKIKRIWSQRFKVKPVTNKRQIPETYFQNWCGNKLLISALENTRFSLFKVSVLTFETHLT